MPADASPATQPTGAAAVSQPPEIDVATVEPDALPKRGFNLSLSAPDAAWSLQAQRAYLVTTDEGATQVWIVAQLQRDEDVMGAQVISEVSDRIEVRAPADAKARWFVMGRTWNGGDDEAGEAGEAGEGGEGGEGGGSVAFVADMDAYARQLRDARLLYEAGRSDE